MKEAAGEANMTVITIVLIAIVLGIGTLVVNNLMDNTAKNSACSSAGGSWKGGKCCSALYANGACNGTLNCVKNNSNWSCS